MIKAWVVAAIVVAFAGVAGAEPAVVIARRATATGPALASDEYASCTYVLSTAATGALSPVVNVTFGPGEPIAGTATWGGGKYTLLTGVIFKNVAPPQAKMFLVPTGVSPGAIIDGPATILGITNGDQLQLGFGDPNASGLCGGNDMPDGFKWTGTPLRLPAGKRLCGSVPAVQPGTSLRVLITYQ